VTSYLIGLYYHAKYRCCEDRLLKYWLILTDVNRQDVSEYYTIFAKIVHHLGEIIGSF